MEDATDQAPPLATNLSSAELRLVLTAERLFSERSFDSVSMREIAVAAQNGNNNAVQYYFGNKDKLLQEIFRYRVSEMNAARQAMLEHAEAANLLSDAHTLFAIVCLPHIDLVDERRKHPYARLLIHYMMKERAAGVRHVTDEASDISIALRRTLELIRARIAYVPPLLGDSRINLCTVMFLAMLVRVDNTPSNAMSADIFSTVVRDTLEIAVAALVAPHRGGG
jgi:AcrR family transcriptional regulator